MTIGIRPFYSEAHMRAKVTDQGVLLPKQWFEYVDEVEMVAKTHHTL